MILQVDAALLRIPESVHDASCDDRVLNRLVCFRLQIPRMMHIRLEGCNSVHEVLYPSEYDSRVEHAPVKQ